MDFISSFIRYFVFPYMEIFKHNKIRKKLAYLKDMENKNYDEILKKQEEDLRTLLLHCIDNVPAYYDYKYLKKLIEKNPYDALSKFPILTKKEFNKNKNLFIANNIVCSKLIPNKTGGSTGEPVSFYMDREMVEWYEAARWQGLSRWGINIGDRSVMLWAPVDEMKTKRGYYKEKYLKNRILISSWEICNDKLKEILKTIYDYKPIYFYAYPSAAFKLAKLIKENNIKINFNLKGIVVTGENLYIIQKELIEEVFKCPVINEYGAKDAGIIAYQCPKGGLHLTILNAFYEFLPIEKYDTENRKIIVTDLHNFVMPRIRYDLGDIVKISTQNCKCGNLMPTLKEINGRQDEMFIGKNGKIFDSHFFTRLVKKMNNIIQFQVIQHNVDEMTLKIIKGDNFREIDVDIIIYEIINAFGKIKVNIEYVDQISPSKSGKMRFALREFSL